MDSRILELLQAMEPISLDQMSSIRLMNRTDTKFVTNKETLIQLLMLAKPQYYSQEINGNRIANYSTIYWDTPDHIFYRNHHDGHFPRQKVRVRTYVDTNITFLEVKTKNNHARTKKKRVEVPHNDQLKEVGAESFLQEKVHRGLDDMLPVIQNQFQRITLVNYGKTERLTIDFNVKFNNLETNNQKGTGELVIIELKRDGNVPSPILSILRQLRVKPSGFSKYCIGSMLTNPALKRNLFKKKYIRINKLVNKRIS